MILTYIKPVIATDFYWVLYTNHYNSSISKYKLTILHIINKKELLFAFTILSLDTQINQLVLILFIFLDLISLAMKCIILFLPSNLYIHIKGCVTQDLNC